MVIENNVSNSRRSITYFRGESLMVIENNVSNSRRSITYFRGESLIRTQGHGSRTPIER